MAVKPAFFSKPHEEWTSRGKALAMRYWIQNTNNVITGIDMRTRVPPPVYSNAVQELMAAYTVPGADCIPFGRITDAEARAMIETEITSGPDDPEELVEQKATVAAMIKELKEYMDGGGHAQTYFVKLEQRQQLESETMMTVRDEVSKLRREGDYEGAKAALDRYNAYLKSKGLPSIRMKTGPGRKKKEEQKMKRVMIVAAFAFAAALAACAEEDYSAFKGLSKEQRKALSPEQRVKYKRYLMMRRYGGYIDQRQPDSGKFVFVNAQGTVPSAAWSNQYEIISDAFSVEVSEAKHDAAVTPANASEAVKKCGGKAGLVVVDQAGLPTLLIAPEAGWGIVNVGALKADKPDGDKLANRVRREIWRGFAMVAGSPNTEWPRCLLGSICSLSDLDNIQSEAVSPEPASKMQKHLLKLGIKPFKRVTYKQACREGWAPPPANEFQKAIWDEIHKLPEKPMKIEFDPAKGK